MDQDQIPTAFLDMPISSHALRRRLPSFLDGTTLPIVVAALAGAFAVAFFGLRDFSFTDYEGEAKPAIDHLIAGDLAGYMHAMPGYSGAVMMQSPFALVGNLLGPDHDVWAWRAQAIPGMALLVGLGIVLGLRVSRGIGGNAGTAWGCVTAVLVGGAPFALLAAQTGHVEEAMIAGLAVASVLLAARGNVTIAAGLVGLAAASKPWAVIAIPVVLLACSDRRALVRATVVCFVVGAAVMAPTFVAGGSARVTASAHSSTSGIFKPDNVFWFAGRTNPKWAQVQEAKTDKLFQADATKASWAQRLEPAWAAKVSHPLVIGFAFVLSLAFWRRRRGGILSDDLLLLLSAVCWWRCLLDTWNVHYYALGALLALVAWEANRGRPPVLSCVVTTLAWTTFQIFPASSLTPDTHTAMYLAWALPLGIGMVVRLLAPEAFASASSRLGAPLAARMPTLARALRASPAA
jgi:hypothetical protein